MAKLPSPVDLGPAPDLRSGRPIATIDTSIEGKTIAAGAEALGEGAVRLGRGISAYQSAQDSFDLARRASDFETGRIELDAEFAKDQDFTNREQRYKEKLDKLRGSVVEGASPSVTEKLIIRTDPIIAKSVVTQQTEARKLRGDFEIATTEERGNKLIDGAVSTDDKETRSRIIQSHNDMIDGLVGQGFINRQQGLGMKQQWAQRYALADGVARTDRDPEGVINDLRAQPGSGEAITNRILLAEGTGKNPLSSAQGTGQFIDSTWLDMIKRNRPDLAQGRSDQEILALRADTKLGREMTDRYRQENSAYLSRQGLPTTPGAQYLAHFLGPAGAAAVLRADPKAPVADALIEAVGAKKARAMIAANPSILTGQQAGSVVAWADSKMGGADTGSIYGILRPDQRVQLLQHAEARIKAREIDQSRAIDLQRKQAQLASDTREEGILKDIFGGTPKTTARDVVNDNALTREAKERVARLIQQQTKSHDNSTYGSGFYSMFQRVHAAVDDPTRITDPAVLYDHVGDKGDITLAGMEKLRAEIIGKRTPEGQAEGEMKKQFLAAAKGKITGSNQMLGIRDPKGDDMFLRFMAEALPAYDKGRKDGKSPAQLLNPESSDYVGRSIDQFVRPADKWFSDIVNTPTAATTFDIASIKTIGDAVKAYNAGQISKAQADQLAIDRGWAKARAVVVEPPTVPISR